MSMKIKNMAAAAVDESFEDLEQLAAVAGSDTEDLDTETDDEDEEESEEETEESDDEDGDDSEDDAEDDDSEDEDSVDDESDDDEDETETDDEDASADDEADSEEEIEYEDIDDDEDGDDEVTESDDEECDSSEGGEVDEDAVLASLQAQGLCVVISTADQIDERDFGIAVAELEDDEMEDEEVDSEDEDASDDESEEEIETEDDDDNSEDETDDEDEDSSEDDGESEDADEDSEEETEDSEDEDGESEDDSETDDEDETEEDTDASEDIDAERLAPVASREMLAHASHNDVSLVFHSSKTDPVWNVIVAGVPAARIALSGFGDGAEEVRSFFVTQKFADSLKQAMATQGVLNLLDSSSAEFYANAYKNSEVFAEARAAAEEVSSKKVSAAVAGVREDFVDSLKVAAAGMTKNYFQGKPHELKRALFIAMSSEGVMNPQRIIEEAFASASDAYFETVADIAVELLDMPAEARDTIRTSIAGAGTVTASVATSSVREQKQEATASALDMVRSLRTTATAHTDVGVATGSKSDRKNAIRGLFAGK